MLRGPDTPVMASGPITVRDLDAAVMQKPPNALSRLLRIGSNVELQNRSPVQAVASQPPFVNSSTQGRYELGRDLRWRLIKRNDGASGLDSIMGMSTGQQGNLILPHYDVYGTPDRNCSVGAAFYGPILASRLGNTAHILSSHGQA